MTYRRYGHPGRVLVAALLGAALLVGLLPQRPAAAFAVAGGIRLNAVEARLVQLINHARAVRGIPALTPAPGTVDMARRWSASQATRNVLAHNPGLTRVVPYYGSRGWTAVAENVGVGTGADALFAAYMASPGHRANILDRAFRYLGIGWVERPDGRGYNTQVFVDRYSTAYGAVREPAYGGRADVRSVTTFADFESGREPRAKLVRTGTGVNVSSFSVDAPSAGDQAGRFSISETAHGPGGYAELQLRDMVDLTTRRTMTVSLTAGTRTGRPLTVDVAVRSWLGDTVRVGTFTIPSGSRVTQTVPLPAAARRLRNEVVVRVNRSALQALDPYAYRGRAARVVVWHLGFQS